MFEKLKGVEDRFLEVEKRLSDPEIVNDRQTYQNYVREHAELNKVVTVFREYKQILQDIEESTELLNDSDPEIKNLARDELSDLNQKKVDLEEELRKLLLPLPDGPLISTVTFLAAIRFDKRNNFVLTSSPKVYPKVCSVK